MQTQSPRSPTPLSVLKWILGLRRSGQFTPAQKALNATFPLWPAFALLAAPIPASATLSKVTGPGQVVVGKARFTVITPHLIRLEYSEASQFEDHPTLFALHRDPRVSEFRVSEQNGLVTLHTPKIQLHYRPNGEHFHQKNLTAEIQEGIGPKINWKCGDLNTQNLGGTVSTLDGARGPVDLGFGLLARDGWSVVSDSGTPILDQGWIKSRPRRQDIDWYFFAYGSNYRAALQSLTTVSGKVPMPRKAVLGSWYSRYWPYTSTDYRDLVREYEQNDFPLDIVVMDMDWHEQDRTESGSWPGVRGWTGWTWNHHLLPDAKELLSWFHQKGLSVTLNNHPADGVGPGETQYHEFMKELGKPVSPHPSATVPFDATDRTYMAGFFKKILSPLEKEGVDFWWLDWQQEPYTRKIPELSHLQWLNHLFYQHSESSGLRGLSFSRWGGWGDHRNPIHFSGDTDTGFPMLAFEVYMTATAGNQGCFFWSHDIGGFMGARNDEAAARWVQFGAVSASLRLHSARSEELDRRPWKFPPEIRDSMKKAFHLRSELMPYIYSQVHRSHELSTPLTQPMYWEHPELNEAYQFPQEYYFGENFIAAPIAHPGILTGEKVLARQRIWLPPGTWYHWFTGERIEGPRQLEVESSLDEFPLFARGGTPILLQPYTQRMTRTPLKHLNMRIYPSRSGSTVLYEDDGETQDYLKGLSVKTRLTYERRGRKSVLTMGAAEGAYPGAEQNRSYTLHFANAEGPSHTLLNGNPIEPKVLPTERAFEVEVPSTSVHHPLTVEVEFTESDPPLQPSPKKKRD